MIKNTVFMKHLKRFFAIGLALVVTITLSACSGSSDSAPTYGLDVNDIYASNGATNLTVGELYDELKRNSLGYLNTLIDEVVFSEYIAKVDTTNATHKEKLAEYMLTAIFGSSDDETLADLKDSDINDKIIAYVDKMYIEGYTLDIDTDFDFEGGVPSVETIQETSAFTKLKDFYVIDVAKYLYAIDMLEKEIAEQDADAKDDDDIYPYFTDANYASYYDANYNYSDDVNAVIIRFVSSDEADEVFRKFGIKAYKGEWYQIKLPTNAEGLTDVSIWDKESDYNTYYDNYEISTSSLTNVDNSIKNNGNGNETILKIFIEMYNYIYTYRNDITYTSSVGTATNAPKDFLSQYYIVKDIIDNDDKDADAYDELVTTLNSTDSNKAATTFTKEKLDNYSTSLTTYINDTLRITAELDEDTNEELSFTQYTSTSRNYGSNYYVVFKLSETPEDEFYTTEEDEDGNTVYTFLDEDLKATIYQEMFDEKLTNSYISNKASERMEDLELNIYDSIINLLYTQSNADHKTKGSSDKYVFEITYGSTTLNVTADQIYEKLEEIYGPSTSVTLLFDKYIVETEYYTDLKADYDDYKQMVATTLTYFANDAYSSYGYSSSMGKYNFMLLYFRTANVDKAIEYLMLQDAKSAFYLEITTEDYFHTTMEEFYELAYENYYSLTLTNILVYADFDEDGIADEDYFTTNTEASDLMGAMTASAKQELAEELVSDLITYAKNSTSSLATSFTEVVAEYNSSSRITPSSDPAYSGSIEHKWAKYRSAGLLISTTSLGEFTNTSNLDEQIQELVFDLYSDADNNEIIYNNAFSGSYLVESTDTNNSQAVLTADGYNVLLVTGGNGKTNIDFENEKTELYEKVPVKINDNQYKIYDLSSQGEMATTDQITVYCIEYFRTGSSASLSTSASAHLSAYLQPALAKFNSEVSQLMIMNKFLTVTSTEADFADRLSTYITYKQTELDGYTANDNFTGFWNSAIYTGGAN